MYYYREIYKINQKYKELYIHKPYIAMIKMIFRNFLYFLQYSENLYSDSPEKEKLIKQYFTVSNKNISYLNRQYLKSREEKYRQRIKAKKESIGTGETFHIVFITDNQYAFPTAVAISSIEYNCNPSTKYQIHIIGVDLEKNMKDVLLRSGKHVECIDVSEDLLDIEFEHEHVSKAALFKFKIPEIFQSIDKILYLDSDMLILGDLAEIFESNVEKKYGAAVKDHHILKGNYEGIRKINTKNYFNSGMLLMNLKEMRKDNMTDTLLAIKREISCDEIFTFMDQDTFNIAFQDKVNYLSIKYNFLNCYYEEIGQYEMHKLTGIPFEEICHIYDCPRILHIGGSNKPWKTILGENRMLYEKYMLINKLYRET